MSIGVMTLVWERYPGAGSELLAMLALANWCNDDGGSLYPSIKQLAMKMRVSRSQAQRILHGLMPADEKAKTDGNWYVRVVGNDNGGAPGTTRQYQLNVARLKSLPEINAETGRTDATGSAGATGRTDAQDGSHGCDGTGRMGATQTVIEPSVKHQESTARARGDLFPASGEVAQPQPEAQPEATPKTELLVALDETRAVAVVEHRKRIRKPLTSYGAKLLAMKFAKCADPNAAADAMIAHGWQGFEPEWLETRRPAGSAASRERAPAKKPRNVVEAAQRRLQQLAEEEARGALAFDH